MELFEWDENKRQSNILKHKIDFEDAIYIWDGPVLEVRDDRFVYSEDRIIAVGECHGHVLVVVYTMRGEICRIISARKASARERKNYYQEIGRPSAG